MGRPREVKGGGCAMTFYLNDSRVNDFRELCKKHGISVSEGLRQLMEQELEKNEIGAINPINIQYGLRAISVSKPGITIPLDAWIDVDEAKTIMNAAVKHDQHLAFANIRKVFQQLQLKTTGKITT